MEIVEKQPFGYPCLCGDIIRGCPLIFMRGKHLQGRIDYCLLFFFGQMEKLFVNGTPPDCFGLTGRVKYNFSLAD